MTNVKISELPEGTKAELGFVVGVSSDGTPATEKFPPEVFMPDVASVSADGLLSSADKTKLDGIADAATANDTDANLKARANHTGTQVATTVTVAADATHGITAGDLQATLVALATRVKALEDA